MRTGIYPCSEPVEAYEATEQCIQCLTLEKALPRLVLHLCPACFLGAYSHLLQPPPKTNHLHVLTPCTFQTGNTLTSAPVSQHAERLANMGLMSVFVSFFGKGVDICSSLLHNHNFGSTCFMQVVFFFSTFVHICSSLHNKPTFGKKASFWNPYPLFSSFKITPGFLEHKRDGFEFSWSQLLFRNAKGAQPQLCEESLWSDTGFGKDFVRESACRHFDLHVCVGLYQRLWNLNAMGKDNTTFTMRPTSPAASW